MLWEWRIDLELSDTDVFAASRLQDFGQPDLYCPLVQVHLFDNESAALACCM